MSAVQAVLDQLSGVQKNGSGWTARCPVRTHGKGRGDVEPSLSVSEGDDGRVLVKCHAGCSYADVMAALSHGNGHGNGKAGQVRSWEIRGPSGEVVAVHHRRDKPDGEKRKSVWWTRPDGSKGLDGMKTADLPLYGSEKAREFPDDLPVVVVEGEKAADALAGLWPPTVATVTGASGTPGADALEVLRGRQVILWPDADGPGKEHMRRVGERLRYVAQEVRVFKWEDAPPGGDAADHSAIQSRRREEVRELVSAWSASPIFEPSPQSPPYIERDQGTGFLRSVRFNEIPDPGPRRYLLEGLIPESYPTMIHGDGGVAKSMLALSLGLAVARGGTWLGRDAGEGVPVLYLDFELDAGEQRRRVNRLARGEYLDRVPDNLLYMCALGHPAREAFVAALEECREHGVKLLVVDSLGVALGGDAEAARDVIAFHQKVIEPFRASGIAVFIIDHQSKLQSGQKYGDKSAFGSVYKGNLSRSVVQAEAVERSEGSLSVRLRHKKHNFGPLADPVEVKLRFTEEAVTVEAADLNAADLAGEPSLNSVDRVRMALEAGPAYPDEIAEMTALALKTVRNKLSQLRKAGEVEATGDVADDGRTERIRLVPSPSPIRDGDQGTGGNEDFWRIVNEGEEPQDGEEEEG